MMALSFFIVGAVFGLYAGLVIMFIIAISDEGMKTERKIKNELH